MPFDLGFNFRGTAGYVTDGAEGVPVLGEAYPHTYTNGNGDSINAGWTSGPLAGVNRASGNDPRIAGTNYDWTDGTPSVFEVDLSSGSAPGAGDYDIDLALGDALGTSMTEVTVTDTATVLIDATLGTLTTGAGYYYDATVTQRNATTTWNGVTAPVTFATTVARVNLGVNNQPGWLGHLAHFRLTLQETAAFDKYAAIVQLQQSFQPYACATLDTRFTDFQIAPIAQIAEVLQNPVAARQFAASAQTTRLNKAVMPMGFSDVPVSWAGAYLRGGEVSWIELEVPTAPRAGEISWVEFEVPGGEGNYGYTGRLRAGAPPGWSRTD